MASSTAVDPRQLLNALSSLLTPKGEIKDEDHVDKILSFMKSSRKLVSKCVYMNIIKSTKPQPVLMKFVECGGWEMINHWLHDGLENENNIVVTEVMKVLKHLPVTIDILKKNDTAKTIKQLSKNDGNELQPIASDLVGCWMKVIKHSPLPEKPAVKKKKLRVRKEENNGNTSETIEKTEPQKSEEKVKKVGKLKITQIKTGKPVVKPKDDNSPTTPKTFDPPKPKKTKVSGPAHAKTRSTGLEMAPPLPKMRIKKKPVAATTDKKPPTIKREGPILDKVIQPVEKKVKQEVDNNANDPVSPKTKVPPKVNKVHIVHESAGFMDALLAPPTAPIRRKPKKPTVKPTSPKGGPKNAFDVSDPNAEPSNGKDVKTEAPKIRFYSAGTAEDEESKDADDNKSGTKKKRKTVRWKTEENLVSVHYFELDESERVNVNKVSNFADAKRLERESEKETMMAVKKVQPNEDNKSSKGAIEFIPWRAPVLIHIDNAPPEAVCSSQEKDTQQQREMAVLQVLFFDKASLPETPMEPDPEILEPSEVKRIPLEDESNAEAEEEFDPNEPYDPNEDYDPNVAYDMSGQPYDPDEPFDPNQMEDPNAPSTYDNMHQVLSTLMGQGQEEDMTSKLKEIMDTLKGHGGGPHRMPFNPNNPGAFMRPPIRGRGGLLGNVPMPFRGPHPPPFPPFPPGMGPGEPRGPPPRGGMRGMRGSRGMRGGRGARGRGRSEPCWHFMNRGGCRMGNQCHFLHPGINGPLLL